MMDLNEKRVTVFAFLAKAGARVLVSEKMDGASSQDQFLNFEEMV